MLPISAFSNSKRHVEVFQTYVLLVLKQTAKYFPSGEKAADFASNKSEKVSGPVVYSFLMKIPVFMSTIETAESPEP